VLKKYSLRLGNEDMVLWFIGKSGAGKSEIGNRLYSIIKANTPNVIYLDGDVLRSVFSQDLGHTIQERRISETRRSRLCHLLSGQGIHVICSALSNAPDIQKWNRQNIKEYFEVYLKADKKVLYGRDHKGIYKKFLNNEIENVVGEDIPFQEPEKPWMTIINDNSRKPQEIAKDIYKNLKLHIQTI
jgi:cytidine diphosphoramidate kinase